jgi:hypothetical protein
MLHPVTQDTEARQLSPKGRKIFGCFGVAVGSLFLVLGLTVIWQAWQRDRAQAATGSWPSIEGKVVAFNRMKDGDSPAKSPLLYEFSVSGAIYRSTQIALVDAKNLEYQEWMALANRLPSEGAVTVYYDPTDPSRSVLKPGRLKVSSHGMQFGLYFAGFAAIWMTIWWSGTVWLPNMLSKEMITK